MEICDSLVRLQAHAGPGALFYHGGKHVTSLISLISLTKYVLSDTVYHIARWLKGQLAVIMRCFLSREWMSDLLSVV